MADNRSYETLTKDRQYWKVVEPMYNRPGLSLAGLAQERRNGQHDTSRTFRRRLRKVAKIGGANVSHHIRLRYSTTDGAMSCVTL
jgi:hypothetical protein